MSVCPCTLVPIKNGKVAGGVFPECWAYRDLWSKLLDNVATPRSLTSKRDISPVPQRCQDRHQDTISRALRLSESRRAMVAAKLANHPAHRPNGTAPIGALTQDGAADMLNVDRRSVQRARE